MSSKIYPIGIQNFEKIRKDGYFYIDKTALIYQMVKTGSYYFLSRPRRFGKSLLISTLEAYFLGKKELFEGLAIEKLEKDWTVYPIFHMDLNTEKYDTRESLDSILNFTLEKWEQQYGTAPSETTFETFDAVSTALSATPLAVAVIASPAEDIMLCALAGIFTSSIFLRS